MRKQLEAIRQDLLRITDQLLQLTDGPAPVGRDADDLAADARMREYMKEIGKALQVPCPHCGNHQLVSIRRGLPLDYYCLNCGMEGEIR